MEISEFLERSSTEELTVQKAVVESLAADKAEQDERIGTLQAENNLLRGEISGLKQQIGELKKSLTKVGDLLSANAEGETSSKIALLDRNYEIDDRFIGETRDHVLEVIKEARDAAEKEGRIRRAQVLEGVLVANEPSGNLLKRRQALQKLFNDNGNILTGLVIEQLEKDGISHKNGETYLLPVEIIKRTY